VVEVFFFLFFLPVTEICIYFISFIYILKYLKNKLCLKENYTNFTKVNAILMVVVQCNSTQLPADSSQNVGFSALS